MASIEYIDNRFEIYEKNQLIEDKERIGLQSFWAWEQKLLKQE